MFLWCGFSIVAVRKSINWKYVKYEIGKVMKPPELPSNDNNTFTKLPVSVLSELTLISMV